MPRINLIESLSNPYYIGCARSSLWRRIKLPPGQTSVTFIRTQRGGLFHPLFLVTFIILDVQYGHLRIKEITFVVQILWDFVVPGTIRKPTESSCPWPCQAYTGKDNDTPRILGVHMLMARIGKQIYLVPSDTDHTGWTSGRSPPRFLLGDCYRRRSWW